MQLKDSQILLLRVGQEPNDLGVSDAELFFQITPEIRVPCKTLDGFSLRMSDLKQWIKDNSSDENKDDFIAWDYNTSTNDLILWFSNPNLQTVFLLQSIGTIL